MLEIGKIYKVDGGILAYTSVQSPSFWQNGITSQKSKNELINFHRDFLKNQTVNISKNSIITFLGFVENDIYFRVLYNNKILYINSGIEKYLLPVD